MSKIVHRKKQNPFLAAFEETGNVCRAAEMAGCHRNSHYAWLVNDPDYPARFSEAERRAGQRLEEEARRRAAEGLKRLKFHKGEPIIDPETGEPYFEHEYSDVLLIFLLKGIFPEKYRERYEHMIDGKVTLEASYDATWYGESHDPRTDAASDPGPVAPLPLQDSGNGSKVGKNGNGTHRGG